MFFCNFYLFLIFFELNSTNFILVVFVFFSQCDRTEERKARKQRNVVAMATQKKQEKKGYQQLKVEKKRE